MKDNRTPSKEMKSNWTTSDQVQNPTSGSNMRHRNRLGTDHRRIKPKSRELGDPRDRTHQRSTKMEIEISLKSTRLEYGTGYCTECAPHYFELATTGIVLVSSYRKDKPLPAFSEKIFRDILEPMARTQVPQLYK